MGYSISQEQHDKLERNRREGRLCAMSTGRGGCFTRATWRERWESWPYKIGEGHRLVSIMTHCGRHHLEPGYEGMNFRVLSVERIKR